MGSLLICGRPIELFSFDLWETVVREDYEDVRQRMRADFIAQKLGIEPEKAAAALHESSRIFFETYRKTHRTMLTGERLDILLNTLNASMSRSDYEETVAYLSAVSLKVPPPLMEGLPEFLALLNKNKVPAVMISDTGFTNGQDMRSLLKEYNIAHYFKFFVFSDEERIAKPQRGVFEKVMRAFPHIAAERILHMGDNPDTDIAGAERMGWQRILFQRNEEVSRKHFTDRNDLVRVSSYGEVLRLCTETA